jgi:isopenicillin N synthase-like dioxygenase
MQGIPTLDLSRYRRGKDGERAQFADALRDGLCEFGFVVVEGHAIEPGLVRSVYGKFEDFFSRSPDEKNGCAGVTGGQRGYTPFGVEHAKGHALPDLKEFFHVGQPLPGEHFADTTAPGGLAKEISAYPRNVWPEKAVELEVDSLRLYRALERCGVEILRALETSFGLVPDCLAGMLSGGNSILRALHYPPLDAELPKGSLRAAAHEDINLITLLCEASDSGLEIFLPRSGGWVPVEVAPGQIVVDSGDMVSRVTNDIVPATTHRVVNPPGPGDSSEADRPGGGHRYSLPFFAHPRPSCDLSVMEPFVSASRPAAYAPITAGEYLAERLREIGLLDDATRREDATARPSASSVSS